jgi:DNA-binding MarR family transcriptional regulator
MTSSITKTADVDLPGGLNHERMHTLLGYNLAQACIPSFKVFEKYIGKPLEVTQVEYTVLVLIDSNPDATSKQLCQSLGTAAARMSLIIDRLADRKYLTKTQSLVDKRVQHLRLTRSGKAFVDKAEGIAASMENELLRHLTKVEQAVLMELLRKVAVHRKV